jgi:hypothetical protein
MAGKYYGPRGSNVTVVVWYEEDGTLQIEAYAAAGTSGRATAHTSARDRALALQADGKKSIVQTVPVQ